MKKSKIPKSPAGPTDRSDQKGIPDKSGPTVDTTTPVTPADTSHTAEDARSLTATPNVSTTGENDQHGTPPEAGPTPRDDQEGIPEGRGKDVSMAQDHTALAEMVRGLIKSELGTLLKEIAPKQIAPPGRGHGPTCVKKTVSIPEDIWDAMRRQYPEQPASHVLTAALRVYLGLSVKAPTADDQR